MTNKKIITIRGDKFRNKIKMENKGYYESEEDAKETMASIDREFELNEGEN